MVALGMDARDDSKGKVYVSSQSRRVDLPNIPALGYCEA